MHYILLAQDGIPTSVYTKRGESLEKVEWMFDTERRALNHWLIFLVK
jgi:hypothetical protein